MITGLVSPLAQARIPLVLRGASRQELAIEAIIDTGFDGMLTLPAELITSLELPWRRRGRALLADGSSSIFDVHEGMVIWDGNPRRVSVDSAEVDPLVGMRLLYGYELTVQVFSGGQVSIRSLT